MPALNVFKQENNLIQIIKLSKSSTWPPTVGGYAEDLNNLIGKPSLISLPEGDMLFEVQEGSWSWGNSRFSIFKKSWMTFWVVEIHKAC